LQKIKNRGIISYKVKKKKKSLRGIIQIPQGRKEKDNMAKLVSVSAKGAVTVLKAVRDGFVADVKNAGLMVGETALVETPNGEFALELATSDGGERVFVKFGKPVITANDPFVAKVAKEKVAKDTPAVDLPALTL
jgi:hypothetical protein